MPSAAPSDLAAVPLFESLTESQLAEVAAWFEVREVPAGARLAGEGATGHAFFVLTDGQAAVTANGSELAALGPGDFFGEIALVEGGRRTATVTTTAPARVLVLFGDDFGRLRTRYPAVAAALEAAVRERLAR